jgi:hypothetical protein
MISDRNEAVAVGTKEGVARSASFERLDFYKWESGYFAYKGTRGSQYGSRVQQQLAAPATHRFQ